MKFTYIDESGNGEEPILVIAGIVVDATRMHVTKNEWGEIKKMLSGLTAEFPEWKTANFYAGKGGWNRLDGQKRSKVIDDLIKWMEERKHKVHFSAVEKRKLDLCKDFSWGVSLCRDGNPVAWRCAAAHYLLSLDRHHNKERGVKGHTVYIFDRSVKDEADLISFIQSPPCWIHEYYPKNSPVSKKQSALSTIVDAPYFADSKHVHMIELADFFSFLLRAYFEVKDNHREERYAEETNKLCNWIVQIQKILVPKSCRFPSVNKTSINEAFEKISPKSAINL